MNIDTIETTTNDDDDNSNNNIGSIIVRVKRRRDQEPVDRLCIVEEAALPDRKKVRDLIHSFSNLNQDNDDENREIGNENRNAQSLVLSRVQTFQQSNDVDSQTLITATTIKSSKRERNEDDDNNDNNNKQISSNKPVIANHAWITQGKKCLRLNDKGSFLVVDLSQETLSDSTDVKNANVDNNIEESTTIGKAIKKVPILDPPTRRLDLAIENARISGDFTDLNSALLLGANINYQRYENKQTSLMIAVMHANVRMVAKLLMKDVDIFAEDCEGRVAYDYVDRNCASSKRGAMLEIITMLQNAKMKAFQLGNYKNQKEKVKREHSTITGSNTNDDDYVFDIFMVSGTNNQNATESSNDKENLNFDGPTVKIEGLHILDDGRGELVHTYDSDWSDLADDEDVDSNDERYEGNDYPEDEDYESDNNSYERGDARQSGFNNNNDNDYDLDDYDDDNDNDNNNKFQRNNIGRVQRYSTPNDPFADFNRDQQALKELWGEENDDMDEGFNEAEIDYDDAGVGALKEHRERVMAMRERSGLTFASNPREFNARGLPKYGQDISDDEIDEKLLQEAFEETEQYYQTKDNKNRFITARPPKNAVAFDPAMDLSDSD